MTHIASTHTQRVRHLLAEIARNTRERPPADPWAPLLRRLDNNKDLLGRWREGFHKCSVKLGREVARTFNKHKDVGDFCVEEIDAKELGACFAGSGSYQEFEPRIFNDFTGTPKGSFSTYRLDTGEPTPGPLTYTVWDGAAKTAQGWVQKVTLAVDGYYTTDDWPSLDAGKADRMVDVYRADLGLVAWGSNYVKARQELPFICYRLGAHQLIWVGQLMTDDLKPLPGTEDIYLVFFKWVGASEGQHYQHGVMFSFQIDFGKCDVKVAGETFLKGRFPVDEG
jgi:hypothetical protein